MRYRKPRGVVFDFASSVACVPAVVSDRSTDLLLFHTKVRKVSPVMYSASEVNGALDSLNDVSRYS